MQWTQHNTHLLAKIPPFLCSFLLRIIEPTLSASQLMVHTLRISLLSLGFMFLSRLTNGGFTSFCAILLFGRNLALHLLSGLLSNQEICGYEGWRWETIEMSPLGLRVVIVDKRREKGTWKSPEQREKEADCTWPGLSVREGRILGAEGPRHFKGGLWNSLGKARARRLAWRFEMSSRYLWIREPGGQFDLAMQPQLWLSMEPCGPSAGSGEMLPFLRRGHVSQFRGSAGFHPTVRNPSILQLELRLSFLDICTTWDLWV